MFLFFSLLLAFDRSGYEKFLQIVSYVYINIYIFLSECENYLLPFTIFVKSQFAHYDRENWNTQPRVWLPVFGMCVCVCTMYITICAWCLFDCAMFLFVWVVWKSTPYCIIAWYDLWYVYANLTQTREYSL